MNVNRNTHFTTANILFHGLHKFQNDNIKNRQREQVQGLLCEGSGSDLKFTAYWMSSGVCNERSRSN